MNRTLPNASQANRPALVTRRTVLAQAGLLAVAALASACSPAAAPTAAPSLPPAATSTPPPPATVPPANAPAATPLSAATAALQPTLDEMLGQMVMVGFRGYDAPPTSPIAADLRDRSVGSVVLFDFDVALFSPERNIQSPAQVKQLTSELRALSPTPLLIAVDQEGGKVARLNPDHGFPATLSAQELGARNDPAFTYARAAELAATLAAAGINHNLAPVVDVNVNPASPAIGAVGRSFSADPAVVAAQARAFIQAHHDHGLTTTLKHFPGHGSAAADSHLGFVDVTDTWQPIELEPYQDLIKAGVVDAIMTAHVFNSKLDPTYPATLSKSILTGILRRQLGYDGVIISDDMNMRAITGQVGFEEAIVLAVNAGVDILAYGNNLVYEEQVAARALAALRAALAAGTITAERVAASYRRIADLKQRLPPAR